MVATRFGDQSKAPGLDGVSGGIWILAMEELAPRIRTLFTSCLRAGRFPSDWKRATLVLLRKEEKPEISIGL